MLIAGNAKYIITIIMCGGAECSKFLPSIISVRPAEAIDAIVNSKTTVEAMTGINTLPVSQRIQNGTVSAAYRTIMDTRYGTPVSRRISIANHAICHPKNSPTGMKSSSNGSSLHWNEESRSGVSRLSFMDWHERDNGNVHRAAAKDMQAEKTARPAAPCATYCYRALCGSAIAACLVSVPAFVPDQKIVHHLAGQIKAILDEHASSMSSAPIIAKQIVFVM